LSIHDISFHVQETNRRDILFEVLKTLACPPVPEPFAINKQYKANMVENQQGDGDNAEPSTVEPPVKKRKCSKSGDPDKASPKSNGACETATAYVPKEYSSQKAAFIRKLKDEGVANSEATQKWNESTLKKDLLSSLPVGELIRRRFCPKGTKTNPWA
jgi:hypothetical protein